jgi:hypothetical protein
VSASRPWSETTLPPPSPEFLAELRRRAVEYGWTGDFCEIAAFVEEIYAHGGVTVTLEDLFAEVDRKVSP